MRKNKKADLSLSINAIVILILAITMLGLGLAFMRNIFGSATKEFEEVGGTVKKQMIDQMKETNKVVDISRPKIELKAGESTQVFIGFKNDGSSEKSFQISSASITPTSLSNVAGQSCNIDSAGGNEIYLEFKEAPTSVLKGDVVVLPINIKTSANVQQDTCFYEIPVNYTETSSGGTKGSQIIELTVDIIS